MIKRDNSKFKTGRGVFECVQCGKRTRDTGDNDGTDLCPLCNAKAECGNTVSDLTDVPDPWMLFDDCKTVDECHELCDELVRANTPTVRAA